MVLCKLGNYVRAGVCIKLVSTLSLNNLIVAVLLHNVCNFFILALLDLVVLCKILITIGVLAQLSRAN